MNRHGPRRVSRIMVTGLILAAAVPGTAGSETAARTARTGKARIAQARDHAPAGALRATATKHGLTTTPRPVTPSDHLLSAGDPRRVPTYAAAARGMLQEHWKLALPDPRSMLDQRRADTEDLDVLRVGLPGGDLDGDGGQDALSLEYTVTDLFIEGVMGLRGISGIDGSVLWTVSLEGAYDAFPLPVGDVTGDGAEDVLVEALSIDQDDSTAVCPLVACAVAVDLSFHWTITLVSGATGAPAWTKTYEGRLEEVFAYAFGPATFALADVYQVTNGLVLPLLAGDHDGDGLDDIVLNTFDATVAVTEAAVFPPLSFVDVVPFVVLISTTAVMATGDEGTVGFERSAPPSPGGSLLYPAGDAVGDGTSDLVWETLTSIDGPFACVFVFIGTCTQYSHADLDVEMIDGASLTTAWSRRVSGPTAQYAFSLPANADLTGDGKADLVELEHTPLNLESAAISGADGSVVWRRPGSLLGVVGPVGGQPGSDLLDARFIFDAGIGAEITRIDGATGAALLTTQRSFPVPSGFVDLVLFLAGDGDADGVLDVVFDSLSFDFDTHEIASTVVEESGDDGGEIFARVRDEFAFVLPPGNLDGAGGDDLLDIAFTFADTTATVAYRGVSLPAGTTAWSRTDAFDGFFDFLLMPTGDQVGDGGDDAVYSRLQFEGSSLVSRMDGIDGRTGGLTWGYGPDFLPPSAKGGIAGIVTDPEGAPLEFMCVDAVRADGEFAGGDLTEADGTYRIGGLTPGEYRVGFFDCDFGLYGEQWYDAKASFADADAVAVVAGVDMTGIDAALGPAGPLPGAPPNDAFAGAEAVATLPFRTSLSTVAAGLEPAEPQPCAPIGATVWYGYTPDASGVIVAATKGSSYDTVLAVYTGTALEGLDQVACSDDASGDLSSLVQLSVTAGETYWFQVGGFAGDRGDLVLTIV